MCWILRSRRADPTRNDVFTAQNWKPQMHVIGSINTREALQEFAQRKTIATERIGWNHYRWTRRKRDGRAHYREYWERSKSQFLLPFLPEKLVAVMVVDFMLNSHACSWIASDNLMGRMEATEQLQKNTRNSLWHNGEEHMIEESG